MTGNIFVKRLNRSGFHVSELDTDKCFVSNNNPDGYFRMIVVPFYDPNSPFIKYEKTKGGYRVEGEGYIVSGSKEEINEKARHYRRRHTPSGKVEFISQEAKA